MGLFQLKSATPSGRAGCYLKFTIPIYTHLSRVWTVLIKGMPEKKKCHKLVYQHRVSFLITLISFALTESHCAAVLLLFSYIYINASCYSSFLCTRRIIIIQQYYYLYSFFVFVWCLCKQLSFNGTGISEDESSFLSLCRCCIYLRTPSTQASHQLYQSRCASFV